MKPEVNGALAIKARFPDAVLIFIVPDKFSHLRSRLEARRTETNEQIARAPGDRARRDAPSSGISTTWSSTKRRGRTQAVDDLEAIVRAERFRIHRYPETRLKELEDS